jgi:outer membrane protein
MKIQQITKHFALNLLIIFITSTNFFLKPSLSFATEAPAQPGRPRPSFSLGTGVVFSTTPYQGANNTTLPIPQLIFSGEHFFIRGTRAGIHLYNDERLTINLLGAYRFKAYESGDSADLPGIKDRKGTVEAGIRASLRLALVTLSSHILTDVLDEHGGQEIEFRVTKPFRWHRIFLASYLGISLLSDDFSTYYYGVDNTEAIGGRSTYDLGWTVNWQAGLGLRAGLNKNIMLNSALGVELFDQKISDSPIVDQGTRFFAMLGITYMF